MLSFSPYIYNIYIYYIVALSICASRAIDRQLICNRRAIATAQEGINSKGNIMYKYIYIYVYHRFPRKEKPINKNDLLLICFTSHDAPNPTQIAKLNSYREKQTKSGLVWISYVIILPLLLIPSWALVTVAGSVKSLRAPAALTKPPSLSATSPASSAECTKEEQ